LKELSAQSDAVEIHKRLRELQYAATELRASLLRATDDVTPPQPTKRSFISQPRRARGKAVLEAAAIDDATTTTSAEATTSDVCTGQERAQERIREHRRLHQQRHTITNQDAARKRREQAVCPRREDSQVYSPHPVAFG
jgi:hypothetical protein